jgi:hypothetical protein
VSIGTAHELMKEPSARFDARFAGCLYRLIILGGLFAPFAIAPSGMVVGREDPCCDATVHSGRCGPTSGLHLRYWGSAAFL